MIGETHTIKKSADTLSSHNLKSCNKPLGGFINLWFKVSEPLSWLLRLRPQNLSAQLKVAKSYPFRDPASLGRPSWKLFFFFFNFPPLAAHLSALLLFLNSNTACHTNYFCFSICYSDKSIWWRSNTMTLKNLLRTDLHVHPPPPPGQLSIDWLVCMGSAVKINGLKPCTSYIWIITVIFWQNGHG